MKPLRFALLLALALAPRAWAHAMLLQSTPAAGAAVAPPGSIDLIFTEEVQNGASFTLSRDGVPVALGPVALAPNFSELTGAPVAKLAPGVYLVKWQNAARDDGHKMQGSFTFSVK